jgi:AcrR family transcriptional regulator
MTSTGTPVRADVRRNRASILDAAAHCFAEEGVDCQISRIAERAGVGNATVFRHFPAKRDLIVAVLDQGIADVQDVARRELDGTDAVTGLRRFLEHLTASLVTDQALRRAACDGYFDEDALTSRRDLLHVDVGRLVTRCQAENTIRPGVSVDDLMMLVQGVAVSASAAEARTPGAWRRYLDLTLLGVLTG